MIRALLLLLSACSVMSTVEGYIDSPGTVYICSGQGTTTEYCYAKDSADELSELCGLDCHATGVFERTSIIGCWFHCDNPETPDVNEGEGRGCNATGSCWCEP